jgi:hypothetical protein
MFNNPLNGYMLMQLPYNQKEEALKVIKESYPEFNVGLIPFPYRISDTSSSSVNLKFNFIPKPVSDLSETTTPLSQLSM